MCLYVYVCVFMRASALSMHPRIGVKEQENSSLVFPPFLSSRLSLSPVFVSLALPLTRTSGMS